MRDPRSRSPQIGGSGQFNHELTDKEPHIKADPTVSARAQEGWMGEKRWDQKRYHYIIGGRSLCRKLGFYAGELVPASLGLGKEKQSLDCAECYKRLQRRLGV